MDQNEEDSRRIQKEIRAKLVKNAVNRKRDKDGNQQSYCTDSHGARYQKKNRGRGFHGSQKAKMRITMGRCDC